MLLHVAEILVLAFGVGEPAFALDFLGEPELSELHLIAQSSAPKKAKSGVNKKTSRRVTPSKPRAFKPKTKPLVHSIRGEQDLPLITGDIYLLEKIVSPRGEVKIPSSQDKVGRFISFSSFTSLSGFDGCNWFQHNFEFQKDYIKITKENLMTGDCPPTQFHETLPLSPFTVRYEVLNPDPPKNKTSKAPKKSRSPASTKVNTITEAVLSLTSQRTKHKYYYRKSGSPR